jgi:exonuclease SbcD
MRILHTADWHVGKTIRGLSRADEHRAVLDEIVGLATERSVDLVIVAGDLFDTASPTPEAEQIVYQALLGLRASGAQVVVIAGNHDNPNRLLAVAPLFDELAVRVLAIVAAWWMSSPRRPVRLHAWRCCLSCRSGRSCARTS